MAPKDFLVFYGLDNFEEYWSFIFIECLSLDLIHVFSMIRMKLFIFGGNYSEMCPS